MMSQPTEKQFAKMGNGTPVAVAMFVVVASFSASLASAQFWLRSVDEQGTDIVEAAAPSGERLSAARTELRRLGMYLSEYLVRSGNVEAVSRGHIDAARYQLDAELVAYRALPRFPGEAEGLSVVEDRLALLDESMLKALNAANAGSSLVATASMQDVLHPLLERADDALARLKALSTSHTRRSRQAIFESRRDALFVTSTLGVISLVAAIVASILVLRVLRGRASLAREHAALLSERAGKIDFARSRGTPRADARANLAGVTDDVYTDVRPRS